MTPDETGFYRPKTIEDVQQLVRAHAATTDTLIRVCGSAHSQSWAIFASNTENFPNVTNMTTPPKPGKGKTCINVLLDHLDKVEQTAEGFIRAEAGIHLGNDPNAVSGPVPFKDSLIAQMRDKWGLTLSEVGGIIHQTVGGFMMTGSAGGSLQHSFQDDIMVIELVDGQGNLHILRRDDDSKDDFFAALVSMGVMGIIVAVHFKGEPLYNITGHEANVTYEECAFDLFGDDPEKPSLIDFLQSIEYGRINWWPQQGAARVMPWQAQRIAPQIGFVPRPYQEFTEFPNIAQPVYGAIMLILGNLHHPMGTWKKPGGLLTILPPILKDLDDAVALVLKEETLPAPFRTLFKALLVAVEELDHNLTAFVALLEIPAVKKELLQHRPDALVAIIKAFQPLDSTKTSINKGTPQVFQDYGVQGLAMDNAANDQILDILFTEFWFPLSYAPKMMQLLRQHFYKDDDPQAALDRTGMFTYEVYASPPGGAWMGMGYSDGNDAWKDGAVRMEPFWLVNFEEDPSEAFFPQFWDLFRDAGIPYRLHWGKMLPPALQHQDKQGWQDFLRSQYPKWDDFVAKAKGYDPNGLFMSDYWGNVLLGD